jgi:hypothetical protein
LLSNQSALNAAKQFNAASENQTQQFMVQNAINSFNISSQAMSFMWQELRDEADYAFKSTENEKRR